VPARKLAEIFAVEDEAVRHARGRERDGVEVDAGREAREGATRTAEELSGTEEVRRAGLWGGGAEFIAAGVRKHLPRRHGENARKESSGLRSLVRSGYEGPQFARMFHGVFPFVQTGFDEILGDETWM
jgi:hypothetical protein